MNSISHRPPVELPEKFELRDVAYHPAHITAQPERDKTLLIPDVGWTTGYLADYFRRQGIVAEIMPAFDRASLTAGRAQTNSKEYLPLPMLVGSAFRALEQRDEEHLQFLIPYGYGADAGGQYVRAVRTILDRSGHRAAGIDAPILEKLPQHAADADLLFRALLTGDVVYVALASVRAEISPWAIPEEDGLLELARQVSRLPGSGKHLAAVGSPLCVTSLNEGILDTLEREGYRISRMPLAEMFWFLWRDNGTAQQSQLEKWKQQMQDVSRALGAKADAALHCVPRYENTAVVLELSGLSEQCPAPLFELSLDGDWDESSWARLRSFLYYSETGRQETGSPQNFHSAESLPCLRRRGKRRYITASGRAPAERPLSAQIRFSYCLHPFLMLDTYGAELYNQSSGTVCLTKVYRERENHDIYLLP